MKNVLVGHDGVGFSYSAQALAAAGVTPGSTVNADGFSCVWPDFPAGQLDNIEAEGQTIQLAPTSGKTRIGPLGSATNVGSGGSQGTMVVNYSDGTSQQVTVGLSDWTQGAACGGPVTAAWRLGDVEEKEVASASRAASSPDRGQWLGDEVADRLRRQLE